MPVDKETQDAITASINAALKPVTEALTPLSKSVEELSKNQKILADTYTADKTAAAEEAKKASAGTAKDKPADAGKPLTAEEAQKLADDRIAAALKARDDAAQAAAPRNAYIAEKLKDLPPEYRAKLGTDPTKWAAEEQSIRDGFKQAAIAAGFVAKDVAGGNAGAGTPPTQVATAAQAAQYKTAGLSDGEAALASSIKLPA